MDQTLPYIWFRHGKYFSYMVVGFKGKHPHEVFDKMFLKRRARLVFAYQTTGSTIYLIIFASKFRREL